MTFKFFNIGCGEAQNTDDSKRYISSTEPLKEGILRSSFRRIAKTVIEVAAAALTFASVGPAHFACSVGSENHSDSGQIASQNQSVTKISKTDKNGRAAFNANGRTYEINLYDRDTGEPVAGINIIFSIKGEGGFYIILDSNGVYVPKLAGLGIEMDEKADSSATKKVSNVVMYKQGGLCQLPAGFFSTVDLSSEEGMMKPDEWHEEWKTAEKNNTPIPKNPLTENFETKKGDVESLSELNDKIKYLLELFGGELAIETGGIALDPVVLYLGLGWLAKGVQKTLIVPLVADVCAISEKLDWAAYYKALCYEDSDKFEIWKLKTTAFMDIDPVMQNMILLVLPVKSKHNWAPPMAGITGKVIYTDPVDQFYGLFYFEVQLMHVDGKLPTIKSETPLFYPGMPEVNFSFGVSACESINPTYDIGLSTGNVLNSLHPKATLTVKDGEEYTINFYIDEECRTNLLKPSVVSYEDKDKDGFGNKFHLAVSCGEVEGRVSNDKDQNDETPDDSVNLMPSDCTNLNAQDGCSKFKLNATQEIANIGFSCMALDFNDNVYLCASDSASSNSFGLYSFSSDLQKRWVVNNNDNICWTTLVVSLDGTIYIISQYGVFYAINQDGSIKWMLEDTLGLNGRLAVGSNGDTYVASGMLNFLLAVTNGGAEKWVLDDFTVSAVYSPVLNYNEDVITHRYTNTSQPQTVSLLDKDDGDILWNSAISIGVEDGFSIASDGTIYVPTNTVLLALSSKGDFLWSYPKDGSDGWVKVHDPPTIDKDGNIYAVLTTTTGNRLVSLAPDGQLRWELSLGFVASPTITEDSTLYLSGNSVSGLSQSGEYKWEIALPLNGSECPVIVGTDGTIFFLDLSPFSSGKIYAIGGGSKLATSSWPMLRHDPQNSGNVTFPIGSKNK